MSGIKQKKKGWGCPVNSGEQCFASLCSEKLVEHVACEINSRSLARVNLDLPLLSCVGAYPR